MVSNPCLNLFSLHVWLWRKINGTTVKVSSKEVQLAAPRSNWACGPRSQVLIDIISWVGNVKCDQQFGNNLTWADSSDNYNKNWFNEWNVRNNNWLGFYSRKYSETWGAIIMVWINYLDNVFWLTDWQSPIYCEG